MEFSKVISERHSIRKFSEQAVPRELLDSLIQAAIQAPSASNLQAWRFVVADDPALVKKINMFSPGMSGDPKAVIAICSDYKYAESRKSGKHYKDYGCIMDASMAAQNLMLAAVDAGLGTCAIKSYTESAVRKILKLPEYIHLEILIAAGYPAGEGRNVPRKPLAEVVRYNGWEGEA